MYLTLFLIFIIFLLIFVIYYLAPYFNTSLLVVFAYFLSTVYCIILSQNCM